MTTAMIPVEVLREIFEWSLPAYDGASVESFFDGRLSFSADSNSHLLLPMKLAGVCQFWNEVVMNMGHVWSAVVLTGRGVQNGFEMFDNILRRSRAMPLSLTITDIDAVHANDVLKRLEEVCHRVNRLVVGRHVGLPMASVLQITREDLVLIITKIPDHKQFNLSATPRALHLPYGLNNLYPLIRTSLLRQVRLETVFMSELSKILGHAPNLVSCVIEILAVPANAHLTLLRNNCLEELCLSCLAPVGNPVAVDFSGLTRLRRLKLDMVFRGSSGAVHFSPYSGPHLEEVHVGYRVHELDTALSTSLRLRHLVLCYQSLLEDYTTPPLPDFFQSLERITICGQGDIQPLLSLLPCLTIDHLPQP